MFEQETMLVMELAHKHKGRLVQIITESWSLTGTLTAVEQHDNREWEIIYPDYRLIPSGGEIYAVLTIGPWTGRIKGNQPVTVETIKGTLEAPERAALMESNLAHLRAGRDWKPGDPPGLEGTVVEPGEVLADVHAYSSAKGVTMCGRRTDGGEQTAALPARRGRQHYDNPVTCPACLERLY